MNTITTTAATLTLILDAEPGNHKARPAYIAPAYNAAETDADGNHPAYNLIWYTDGITDPEAIDWTDPDEIIPAGVYDPAARRIF